MKVIVCVDDGNGMLFNKRRQSQDRVLRDDVQKMTAGQKLWMNAYSARQFQEGSQTGENVTGVSETAALIVTEDFLRQAGENDFCFVENEKLLPYSDRITEVVVYRWNRSYPGDFHLDLDLKQWRLVQTTEFAGYSHEKITKEIYRK
ncbi:ribonuclease Z [Ruminococcus sp. AF41-9]|nr:ribonuclease Z [Ruminococcus sp. AF41-9]